jgi:hypothetical protein
MEGLKPFITVQTITDHMRSKTIEASLIVGVKRKIAPLLREAI